MSGFEMFVKTIPFNLYAILTLYMVFFTSIVGFDFGLMKKHEENAAKGDLFTSGGEEFQNQETKDPTEGGKYAKGKVIDLIAPMVVMIATAIAAMIWTGHLNGGQNLVEDLPTVLLRNRWCLPVWSQWDSCCFCICRAVSSASRIL